MELKNKSDIKILVVDDRDDNLLSIETILEKQAYSIVKAKSGRAALKILLNEHDFTLILMDVQMPEMNGFETATLIYQREKLRHIPIIFITAHNHNEEYMFEGYKMGAVDFIYKPINPELLRFKVSVFVELYRKTHQLMMQEAKLIAANTRLENEIEERKISEEKVRLLNQQLLQNNTDLKTINEELDRFAYVASHDLQEPLRKILIFSNVVSVKLNNKTDPEVQNYLEKISKASMRMQNLINDLLKFSRHTHDSDDFRMVDLNELLTDVLSDMEMEIQQKKAQINYQSLPSIWAIPSQIRQLFQNLISNSLKFSKTNQLPEINIYSDLLNAAEIGNADLHKNQNFCRIFIRDNGIGFDQKYMNDIFVVFKRLHSYHEFEGTGIGLSICKKIVEKHNGFITAESKINDGSVFIITLPLKLNLQQDTIYNKQA
ncbi:MAG TPA: response regulator, partial [Chitinophagaceae bacterium]|nr:response regulator [Chitinophagaceae bacterium]